MSERAIHARRTPSRAERRVREIMDGGVSSESVQLPDDVNGPIAQRIQFEARAAARLIRSGVPASFFTASPPRRERRREPKAKAQPIAAPPAEVDAEAARAYARSVINQAKYAAQSVFGVCPDSFALGRAVAIAGHSTLPWLDHERVLGADSAKWGEFTRGLREVWVEQRKERG